MASDKKAAISRLLNSLEFYTIKRDLIVFTLLMGFLALLNSDREIQLAGLLFLLPVWGFYLWRIIQILRKPEQYIFCQCTLSQPHCNPWLKSMYFTVVVELPGGKRRVVETHAIFATHGILGPVMEDYVNSSVTIAYNLETEMVVVIG